MSMKHFEIPDEVLNASLVLRKFLQDQCPGARIRGLAIVDNGHYYEADILRQKIDEIIPPREEPVLKSHEQITKPVLPCPISGRGGW